RRLQPLRRAEADHGLGIQQPRGRRQLPGAGQAGLSAAAVAGGLAGSAPLVIGLDLGTSHCKAVAVAPDGAVAAATTGSYPLHSPQAGWAEQSAPEVWQAAAAALRELAPQVPAGRLAGLSLSGAMHSLLPVDA